MRKLCDRFRFWLAYLIAHDWIDDLEYRFSVFLCDQTGGRMSKCYYTTEAMRSVASDYWASVCDECEYYRACCDSDRKGDRHDQSEAASV